MAFDIHKFQFPNESDHYRRARNELLEEEIALRAQIEKVASLRRQLPPGGLVEHYEFDVAFPCEKEKLSLLELFEPGKDTLLAYNYMFAPDAATPCPLCTSFIDGFNGLWPHVAEHVNVAVIAKSSPAKLIKLRQDRSWDNVRLVSSHDNSFQRDYAGETVDGNQMPMMNVFIRNGSEVRHFWGSEMLFAPSDWDSRHIDMQWPLWHFFDITPEGRGGQRYPKLTY